MNYKILKWVRVAVSLVFIIGITAAFIFFVNRESALFSQFLKIQFVPSLLGIFSGGAVVFVLLILLTLLFGRVYCSTLCPLGTFQDSTTRVANLFKSKKKRRFKYDKPKNWIRYSVLSIIAIFFIGGVTAPIAWLDPYSNWGRVSNEIISRVEQLLHNALSNIFPEAIFFRSYAHFAVGSFIFALLFISAVIIFSSLRGRLYCNTICPVGTLLGMLSKISIYKPKIDESKCNKCGLCVINCKSQCIDLENQSVDESRCVSCQNCMQVCKRAAISYKISLRVKENKKIEKIEPASNERRRALIAMGLVGTALAAKAINFKPLLSSKPKITGIAPPGAVSIDHLKRNCTACYACVSACPNNIIQPASMEYGLDGVLLPVLSFKHHFCGYECNMCTTVCPNDALKPMSIEDKQLSQIGEAQFFLEKCIVHTDGTDCGACDEHCPTKAITMVPYGEGSLYIPSLNVDICIGCGGCEYICPAVPEKAMVVYAKAVHGVALKPTEDKQEKVKVDDFGF
ncbi:MAG: hydroxyacid dehydrogenase [Bacteroidetes bacterium HGW-Bacteroidetes-5]|jgi:ferredoxin|nr:MAG: hydroxyacid dehydrogenase [Bacteroidetes bacterium HGW-Bacteroidetes-5]